MWACMAQDPIDAYTRWDGMCSSLPVLLCHSFNNWLVDSNAVPAKPDCQHKQLLLETGADPLRVVKGTQVYKHLLCVSEQSSHADSMNSELLQPII